MDPLARFASLEGPAALEGILRRVTDLPPGPGRSVRVQQLAKALEADPAFALKLREAWSHASAIRLLAETGLPDHPSFLAEGLQRFLDGFIPRLDAEGDLYSLLNRLGLREEDAAWLSSLNPAELGPLAELLRPTPEALTHAARLLAHRAAALGLSRELLDLIPEANDRDSAFFELAHAVRQHAAQPTDPEALTHFRLTLTACRVEEFRALAYLERRGVSTELVFRLDALHAQLDRLELLLAFHRGEPLGQILAAELVLGAASQGSLRALGRSTLKRLARKVVEHTGAQGEHYIASDRRGWKHMAWAAAGGGLLTVGTAVAKYALVAMPLAPLILGLSHTANYAISFGVMHLLGLALASKQPALTAAALARTLEAKEGLEAEVDLVAAIARTQTIAALGNVLVAIPFSFGFAWAWGLLTGHPLLSSETAHHGLHELHPLASWTLPFAALTGVFLWFSSLAAGWAANWSAFRQLPEAVALSPRLRRAFGIQGARALGDFLDRNFDGLFGYTVLGFLLGFVPVLMSKFAGIGLGVRHITLQSAAWALDVASLLQAGETPGHEAIWSLAAIPLIGLLNFGVSFALALRTATRARGLGARERRALWAAIRRAFVRNPWRFIGPPPR
ncbi:MAG TPA: hypothetical protein VJ505_03485 [Holophagaceae bacterium]|nr:hypothetical protein [Holophagaceae bacterium]